jgi:hypothetical protein
VTAPHVPSAFDRVKALVPDAKQSIDKKTHSVTRVFIIPPFLSDFD